MSGSPTTSRDFLDRVVPEIRAGGGRNIVELARALRMPVETVRYKVKGMLKRGIGIHASVDYGKFGLTHYYAYLNLSDKARSNERKFFGLLADQAYLTSCARRLPSNEYFCKFAFPLSTRGGSLRRMLRGLVEEGLLRNAEIHEVSWEKAQMLQPEHFDLKRGAWRIDWNKVRKEPQKESRISGHQGPTSDTTEVLEFDDLDLRIARELEADALTRLSDIAGSLKTTLNNVFYHFHKHVMEGGLVDEYVLRWHGSPKQAQMFVQFQFTNLSVAEEKNARYLLRRLPFLWRDALSLDSGFYVGQAMVPLESYIDTLNYVSSALGDTAFKLKMYVLDAKTRQDFPLPAQLYKNAAWTFHSEETVRQIAARLAKR